MNKFIRVIKYLLNKFIRVIIYASSVDNTSRRSAMNTQKFNSIIETAKAKAAGNKRWINAIEKAADAILNNRWIITPLAHSYAMTTESGETYFANGSCQCKAYANGQPCKHRCAARILDLMEEETATPAVSFAADVEASS